MSRGVVKEYNLDRGYGIIIDSVSKQELTVYANSLTLINDEVFKAGQDVEYDIENNRTRNSAIHVRLC